jgi:methanogenic corrinoid protein MtbC1
MTNPPPGKELPVQSLASIGAAVAALDEKTVLRLVREALDGGTPAAEVIRAVETGMRIVGDRYQRQEIYLSGLIMAGEIFRGVMEIAPAAVYSMQADNARGRVLLGTVAGDIHDIGKNLAEQAFRISGFTVDDLGENVPPQDFFDAAQRIKPDVMGLSGLLTGAFTSMRDTVALFRSRADELEKMPIIIIGGGTIDENIAEYVAPDLWTTDAMEGVRLCEQMLDSRKEGQ